MSSSMLHSCPFCGHVTDVSEILADFMGNPHCTQCGLSASEGNIKMQDDLVSLFNAHMNMRPSLITEETEAPASPSITYSITQHYHHSTHVAQAAAMPRPMQRNAQLQTADRVLEQLKHHNINPSSLSSSQRELFERAMPEQQSRLIQMWQICSEPSKNVSEFIQPNEDLEMSDTIQLANDDNVHVSAEPYMLAGYGFGARTSQSLQLASSTNEPTTGHPYRLSNDPVYHAKAQRWWERTEPTAMEN